jgi:hypothetical protein
MQLTGKKGHFIDSSFLGPFRVVVGRNDASHSKQTISRVLRYSESREVQGRNMKLHGRSSLGGHCFPRTLGNLAGHGTPKYSERKTCFSVEMGDPLSYEVGAAQKNSGKRFG